MRYSRRGLPTVVVPLLVAVAILGYVAGHSRSQSASSEGLRTVTNANVVLHYPGGWRKVENAPQIPGLSIAHQLGLAPNGDAARAGLLVGTLPSGELSPLPGRFVSSLSRLPETRIVSLLEVEAYRYVNVSIPGFNRALTIFVIPNPGGESAALACYAASGRSSDLQACEQTVAGVTLVNQSQTYELLPDPNYARRISAPIATLDRQRLALKRELRTQATGATIRSLATRLAAAFASAATSLAAIEPSFAAGRTQSALTASLARARDAYSALATAAAEESASSAQAALKRTAAAEAEVNGVLEDYELLGYSPATGGLAAGRS